MNFAIRFGAPQGHGAEFGWGDYFTQLVSTPAEAHAAMKKILPYKPDVIKVFTDLAFQERTISASTGWRRRLIFRMGIVPASVDPLFHNSRSRKSSPNDADRLRKYLSRFGLDWNVIAGERGRG